MNKQETIKKLESIKVIGNDAIAACYNESMNAGITLMKKIDEPQKPKTEVFNHDEKFVVEWLDHTTGYHYSLYNAINDAGSEVRSWMKIGFNSNKFARAFMSMDYEVEKEPLYEVIIGNLYLIKKFNNRNDFYFDTSCSLCAWEKSAYQLTEAEIKAIDERYWPFAVPVEEGLEQEEEG
ncbi:TPA: DUF1642 domain-containing protein [Enterococcus faecium]